jgi:hypothetical protein
LYRTMIFLVTYRKSNIRSAKNAPIGPPSKGPIMYGMHCFMAATGPQPAIIITIRGPKSRAGFSEELCHE